jgi:hypothetical protein
VVPYGLFDAFLESRIPIQLRHLRIANQGKVFTLGRETMMITQLEGRPPESKIALKR